MKKLALVVSKESGLFFLYVAYLRWLSSAGLSLSIYDAGSNLVAGFTTTYISCGIENSLGLLVVRFRNAFRLFFKLFLGL